MILEFYVLIKDILRKPFFKAFATTAGALELLRLLPKTSLRVAQTRVETNCEFKTVVIIFLLFQWYQLID